MNLSNIILSNLLLFSKTTESFTSTSISTPFLLKRTNNDQSSTTSLFGGTGTTANYSWKEDQFEIEIHIPIPAETKTKHISYKPKSKSMELSIEIEKGDKKILLDGSRQFRGMIDIDGTFWSLVDCDGTTGDSSSNREIVISIEKLVIPPSDPFAVVDYDWGSVYMNDEDEILSKTYAEAEALDIKEYAASLGVDIDNINMTMVDKSMFSSGLNLTRNTLDELTNSGYAKEVTKMGDGVEFSEEGKVFKPLGDNIGDDEIEDAAIRSSSASSVGGQAKIPFLDTESPWRKSMPVEEARGVEDDSMGGEEEEMNKKKKKNNQEAPPPKYQDPVDALTVSKLKDILRKEGLKVSGNKGELQDRLKNHVNNSLMQKGKGKRQEESTGSSYKENDFQ